MAKREEGSGGSKSRRGGTDSPRQPPYTLYIVLNGMHTHQRGLTLHRQRPEYRTIRISSRHHHSIYRGNALPVQQCINSPSSP